LTAEKAAYGQEEVRRKRRSSPIPNGGGTLSPKRIKEGSKISKYIEAVSAFKCKLCNELALTLSEAEEHLATSHEEFAGNEDWLEIAKRENIRLECPRCENK